MHSGKSLTNATNGSSQANDFRKSLTMHSGEKSSKCNQCDYASSQGSDLRKHLRRTVEKSQTYATNATMPCDLNIHLKTLEKSR